MYFTTSIKVLVRLKYIKSRPKSCNFVIGSNPSPNRQLKARHCLVIFLYGNSLDVYSRFCVWAPQNRVQITRAN